MSRPSVPLLAAASTAPVKQNLVPEAAIHAKARRILGRNFFGLKEVQRIHRRILEPSLYARIPFSEATLRQCCQTHDLRSYSPVDFIDQFPRRDRAKRAAHRSRVPDRWLLLRKAAVPGTPGLLYAEQRSLLSASEVVPLACEMAYMATLAWWTHRERVLPNGFLYCGDRLTSDCRMVIGNNGLVVDLWCSVESCNRLKELIDEKLGLASAIRPETECLV
jgi:hypothetical protein